MEKSAYYFPLLFLVPEFDENEIEHYPFRIVKRKWTTSTFDLATLATRHKLHLPYQLMDVLLSRCNIEMCILDQSALEEAKTFFQTFRLCLYAVGSTPFLSPFVATHSVNDYSGINSRDSDLLRYKMLPELQEGLKSDKVTIEVWPVELSLQSIILSESIKLSKDRFVQAVDKANSWQSIMRKSKSLKVVMDAANSAPKITPLEQSILHIWSALEALFPNVTTELSFKIALYLAQLIASKDQRMDYFEKVRNAYNLRSKITHGAQKSVSIEHWEESWSILIDAVNAIVKRGGMPSEKELLTEMLS